MYDMSGGSQEYVMSNMINRDGSFYSNNAGFNVAPDSKYYDKYTYSTNRLTHGRGKLGDATKETLSSFGNERGGWYSDSSVFSVATLPWLERGGKYNSSDAGIFYFEYIYGGSGDYSTRAVLIP